MVQQNMTTLDKQYFRTGILDRSGINIIVYIHIETMYSYKLDSGELAFVFLLVSGMVGLGISSIILFGKF